MSLFSLKQNTITLCISNETSVQLIITNCWEGALDVDDEK
jgi:hypothetical protein